MTSNVKSCIPIHLKFHHTVITMSTFAMQCPPWKYYTTEESLTESAVHMVNTAPLTAVAEVEFFGDKVVLHFAVVSAGAWRGTQKRNLFVCKHKMLIMSHNHHLRLNSHTTRRSIPGSTLLISKVQYIWDKGVHTGIRGCPTLQYWYI